MLGVWNELCAGLVEDNRRLVEGLRQIIGALEQKDATAAKAIAERLDHRCGPHIEFQERYLYPEVEKCDGEARATRLYERNAQTIAALVQLQQVELTALGSPLLNARWLERVREGLEHAASGHLLLGYLRSLDAARHVYLLERRNALREKGRRWSQLHPVSEA